MTRYRAREGPGSTLDAFLAEEGFLDEATEHAVKSVLAWQIEQAMQAQSLTKVPWPGGWIRAGRSSTGSSTRRIPR